MPLNNVPTVVLSVCMCVNKYQVKEGKVRVVREGGMVKEGTQLERSREMAVLIRLVASPATSKIRIIVSGAA